MEDQESLESRTRFRQFTDTVQSLVNMFFAHGVMTPGIVIGRVFFTSDELFRMVESAIRSRTYFI